MTQYFPPETGGPPNRLASLGRGLVETGHDVTVLTAKPNHPEGVIWEEYRGGLVVEGSQQGMEILHTWVYARPEKTFFTRLAFYFSFPLMAIATSFQLRGRYDVVLASSPPLPVGIAGWALARLKGGRFVFDVRDLWPDVAVAMGELEGPWLVRSAKALERFLYRRADGISAVTRGFLREIQDSLDGDVPMAHVPNGTEPGRFRCDADRKRLRQELDLPEGFLVTYAGNVGICQGLDHVLDAAERVRSRGLNVRFLFVGDGPVKQELVDSMKRRDLANVVFRPRVELDEAVGYMAASDSLLVPLADHPIYRTFIPSKLFDGMAVGRPILLSVDGEAREVLEDADAGLYYPAKDAKALVDRVERLMADPSSAEQMGARGREYVMEHFDRARQARKMVRFLESLVEAGRA